MAMIFLTVSACKLILWSFFISAIWPSYWSCPCTFSYRNLPRSEATRHTKGVIAHGQNPPSPAALTWQNHSIGALASHLPGASCAMLPFWLVRNWSTYERVFMSSSWETALCWPWTLLARLSLRALKTWAGMVVVVSKNVGCFLPVSGR